MDELGTNELGVWKKGEERAVRIGVIGAGAWGLPSALELADRGHEVTLFDRDVPGGVLSSSRGSTRLWRLADARPEVGVALVAAVAAMDRLSERLGAELYNRNGLLWRDDASLASTSAVLDASGGAYDRIPADRVGEVFAGMQPDGRDALLIRDAGAVYAERLLRRAFDAFRASDGEFLPHTRVADLRRHGWGVELVDDRGAVQAFDEVVIAAGPGAQRLLRRIDIELPLRSYLEQVVHFGSRADPDATLDAPCLFDGPRGGAAGIYGMPSPGSGYKIGLDRPLRVVTEDDEDRTPDPERTRELEERVRSGFHGIVPDVLETQVCVWTDSPDGKFIIDRVEPGIVVACGDAGEGFKFSALVGEVVADLVEGTRPATGDTFRLDRHDWGALPVRRVPTAMGQL